MTLWFGLYTSDTELAELLYISIEAGPEVSAADYFQYFVLIKMSSKDVIMIILENLCVEVTSKWYINSVVEEEYVKIVKSRLHFSVLILILFSFFYFLFLEQQGLGLEVTGHTVTSVTI